MARPRKNLTDEQIVQLEALAAVLSQEQIADYFGMHADTLRARMQEDDAVFLAYKRGRANAIFDVADGLLQRARRGDNTAAIFFLKTQAGWKETGRLEVDGDLPMIVVRKGEDE